MMQTLDFLDTFLKPQEKSYDTVPDNIESVPEFAVDRIPSTKWWDDRAPIVLVSLLRTLTKVIILNCRIITISKTLCCRDRTFFNRRYDICSSRRRNRSSTICRMYWFCYCNTWFHNHDKK